MVALQEVHGSKEMFNVFMHRASSEFHFFWSGNANNSSGGTVVMLRKRLFDGASFNIDEVERGRALRVEARYVNGKSLVLWIIHNYGIVNRNSLLDYLERDLKRSRQDPSSFVAFVQGDFNFISHGESRFFAANQTRRSESNSGTMCRRWHDVLDGFVELKQESPTHFVPSSMSLSRIDRVYTSAPSWMVASLHVNGSVIDPPQVLFQKRISDHSPVLTRIAVHAPKPRGEQPIPHEVAASPQFAEILARLEAEIDLDAMDVIQRWREHKKLLRKAGMEARKVILQSEMTSNYSIGQVLISVSRAVFRNDCRTAKVLIDNSAVARKHLLLCGNSVRLLDPEAFSNEIDNAKVSMLQLEVDDLEGEIQNSLNTSGNAKLKGLKRRQLNASRQSMLWAPVAKKKILAGVKVSDGSGSACRVLRNEEDVAAALASSWAPTFAHRATSLPLAQETLDKYKTDFSGELAPLFGMTSYGQLRIPRKKRQVATVLPIWHSRERKLAKLCCLYISSLLLVT